MNKNLYVLQTDQLILIRCGLKEQQKIQFKE